MYWGPGILCLLGRLAGDHIKCLSWFMGVLGNQLASPVRVLFILIYRGQLYCLRVRCSFIDVYRDHCVAVIIVQVAGTPGSRIDKNSYAKRIPWTDINRRQTTGKVDKYGHFFTHGIRRRRPPPSERGNTQKCDGEMKND